MSDKVKRFYKRVEIVGDENGYEIELDGRAIKSPGREVLVLPHQSLASELAEEWRRQEEFIDLASMPVMRFAGRVHDNILPKIQSARTEILKFAHSDLLCYRAEQPEPLVERQAKLWDPVLERFVREGNIRFKVSSGILWIDQEAGDMERFASLLEHFDGYVLGALLEVTSLSGSAILALALGKGWLAPAKVWELCHIDEDFQAEQWGKDEDAEQARKYRYGDFLAVVLALNQSP
ncbi:MAG: ATPase [Hyphomicrobiaceae bacterium]|nr:ATPase [Hyphomicrobiaceae bacterium]